MRTSSRTALVAGLLAVITAATPETADAHGGLPIALRILRVPGSDTMYVPVHYWGIWVGAPSPTGQTEWKWICEEAINAERFRLYAVSTDGTYYATNSQGLSYSRQGGCDWPAATGEIATLKTKGVDTDPVDGATAWAAAGTDAVANRDGSRTPAANGLFVTHDHGATWTRAPGIGTSGRTFNSVRVAPGDGKTVYASSMDYQPPFGNAVHRSTDGGATFTEVAVPSITGRGAIGTLELMAVDPRDATVVWARAVVSGGSTTQLLLRIDHAGDPAQTATEVYATDVAALSGAWNSGVNDLAFDLAHGQLFLATRTGLLHAKLDDNPLVFTPVGSLSQAQCVDVNGDTVFACSWNYTPDFAAIASGAASGTQLTPFFVFTDTVGPIDCPKGTSVGDQCPDIWASYASQLGIGEPLDGGTVDAAADGGSSGDGGCACDLGGPTRSAHGPLAAALVGLVLLLRSRRHRRA